VSNEASRNADDSTGRRGQILALLRDDGPLTRIELSRRTALSPTTMTRVVAHLLDDGCVAEGAAVSHGRTGRPGTELSIVPGAYSVIGVQVGVGTVRLGVGDLLGRSEDAGGFDYPVGADAEDVLDRIADHVTTLRDRHGLRGRELLGVGVAVPGPVDQDRRRLVMPINLPWRDVPVADRLEAALGIPVVVEHNVRSMALAEARFGIGRGAESVAFVYLRTGIGAGLVIEGHGFHGGVHGAIEFGHLRVLENGERCVCGGLGCLETVVSDRALRATLSTLGLDGEAAEPFEALLAAATVDPTAAKSVDGVVTHLATALSALVNLLTPQVIILGGAFCAAPPGFLERLSDATKEAVFPVIRPAVRLRPSSLGIDAGVSGAVTAALDHFFYA
jgi:predicted NBD/HSP70 family sugar kinase